MHPAVLVEQVREATSFGGALRRYWMVFVGLGLVVAVAVIAIGELSRSDQPQYHTEALIVANELEIRVDALPKTAVAIFETAATANRIAELSGTGIDPGSLIPAIVRAEPVETTGVIEIDATYSDPELAAIYANTGAEALVRELNRVGPGLGSFSVQTWAQVPTEPIPKGRRQLVIAALFAGAAASLGAAALYAASTRSG